MSDLTGTHVLVAEALGDGSMTVAEIAQLIGASQMGVQSCLRGMVRRGEAVCIKPAKKPQPFRYRMNWKAKEAA